MNSASLIARGQAADARHRDLTIDFLRGLALAVMMVDHLRNHWLSYFTYRAPGFFSAACVFVFLSGYVTGRVYTQQLIQGGFQALAARLWRRAAKVYAIHVLLGGLLIAAACTVPSFAAPFGREVELAATRPLQAFLGTLLLFPCAPLLDILPLYVFFLALAPFVLSAFYQGRANYVFAASLALWACSQAGLLIPLPPFASTFDAAAWQLLFVAALYFGFRQHVQPIEQPKQPHHLNLAIFGAIVALFMLRHSEVFSLSHFSEAIPYWWTDRSRLGPLSLINFFLWAAFFWLVPAPLAALARQGRLFVVMGQHSLHLFLWHTLLIYLFMSLFPQLQSFSVMGQALIVCFALACLVFPIALSVHLFLPKDSFPTRS